MVLTELMVAAVDVVAPSSRFVTAAVVAPINVIGGLFAHWL
jgi:hypothetical protein